MRNHTALTLITLSLTAAHLAYATTYTYVGNNANWTTSSAWSPLGYPYASTDTALVTPSVPATTTNMLTINSNTTVGNLTIGSSGLGLMEVILASDLTASTLTINPGGEFVGTTWTSELYGPVVIHNSGTIASTYSLALNFGNSTTRSSNNGTLQATGASALYLFGYVNTTLDNTGGIIQAIAAANGTGSSISSQISLTGGTLLTDAASSMSIFGNCSNLTATGNFRIGQSTLANVTFNGTVTQLNQQGALTLAGPFTNNAVWSQVGTTTSVVGNQILGGTGSFSLGTACTIAAAAPQASLTIGSQQTLQGQGTLGTNANLTLINNGTILANTANQSFTINSPLTNNALLSAAANSSISITAPLTLSANAILNADGNISLTSTLTGPLHKTGNATLALSQNYTTTSPISLTAGTLQLNGPANAAPTITGNGTLALSGALTLTPSTTASALAGISFANATIPAGNYLDLTSNTLILNPDPSQKSANLSLLQSALTAGASHNAGLFSSTLPATESLALLDNAVLPTPFASFANQPVTNNSLIVTPELLGDATLDGHVDLNDLNIILNHLGATTPLWPAGNFDHAATIDLNDLNAVLNHLGTSTSNPLLPATTPEPASFAALSLAFLTLRRRK